MAFVGDIRPFAGATAPSGWRICDGSLLPIPGNETLAAALGTVYGGDGVTQFGIPDLRGRTPIHSQAGFIQAGQEVGTETISLAPVHLPVHAHDAGCSSAVQNSSDPTGCVVAQSASGFNAYSAFLAGAQMVKDTVGINGQGLPHPNIQPFTSLNFIICTAGIPPA